MALLQTFNLEHLPRSHELHVALFKDVKNADYIQQQLLNGNREFEYAFIDADVILTKIHALAAAYRAANDLWENRLRTRNVHSEVVFCLSPNNNIAESFRRFGVTPKTTRLLAMKLSTPESPSAPTSVQDHLSKIIEGEHIPFEDEHLSGMTETGRARIRKLYKLGSSVGGKVANRNQVDGHPLEEDETKELEMLILGCLALRGATN